MPRGKHQVLLRIDDAALLFGVVAPQHKHEVFAFVAQGRNGGIGKRFPTLARMAARLTRAYRKHRIQQEHALFGPRRKVARMGNGYLQIV